ncbi:MAG: response regulator [Proteobacteria bacterium]|nr:response regulator [Pseudomonadota bacterium]
MASNKPKLLVVDDEPDMLDFLERVLRRQFTVSRTSSAETALELLSTGEYEVLVTDQKMPKVSGLELLERIADRYPSLVRVLISGFTEVPEIQRAVRKSTIHNYILKPVDSRKLLRAIEDAYEVRDGKPFVPPELE